ncbi:N2,N2-dimethylguanosine tRNA methyltransferase [Candida albicans P60002]|uniref:tRNA (guanine(26)-N(2))-dimethyltransferase n=1 Tax=Candida albicans (strain SC5314 / ATCC MYA-2876) TaxID=237561 RepID=Q5A863_CANAL|nr:tRNA (guanine26-N2)-dimethyltransferase [Candida albicans SC5314]KGQ81437.1 N2,N2-dimethylguanosine tRNA methyltransferase [Candida albicans P94015]KHC44864.1 N2,N2-dimethylguanosine tRNA methyltransferase [Candida albicans P60002]KHC54183.1 N2,N2-dimethylguanosine tRNA methyltransferase [Candida albicans P75010]AOW30855.1 tRNA (guanine26-N2)-dimethyltransferase [Candida albicans SC5314]KHC71068.1 N2,N2-dimethylguanosine tRNA methyltransferase [Candida albicans SC5314]|eukprot:XP_717955.1 tRNA (guanine26-N2)-dimethyltransferase [Candida albicans SC5314]
MIKRLVKLLSKMSIPPSSTSAMETTTTNIVQPNSTISQEFNTVQEGKATILTPKQDEVFYNPIQQFNRDLSIMAIKAYDEIRHEKIQAIKKKSKNKRTKLNGLKILESLAASGLRSCRYGLEIPEAGKIVANDMLAEAVKSINKNVEYNKLTDKVVANQGDAIKFMGSTDEKFHIVDLDPYGTAAPFIDSAIQCLEDDGMLLVTCTDAGVLAGSGYPEKCFALYGGNNFGNAYVNGESNHEVGIRLILNLIASTAAKYKKTIEPMLSLSIDYYFRVFVKVKTSPINVKNHASETMLTYGCNGCGHKIVQPLGMKNNTKFQYPKLQGPISSNCQYCGTSYNVAGPMYAGNLHNREFIDKVLKINESSDKEIYVTNERIKGMLTLASNELDDAPFFFNLNQLCSIFKSPPISIEQYTKAVGNLGYKVSLTHAKKNCVKTNLPWNLNLLINRAWQIDQNEKYVKEMESKNVDELNEKIKEKLIKLKDNIGINPSLAESSPGWKILNYFKTNMNEEEKSVSIDFETGNEEFEKIAKLRKVKMVRYQENPRKNWGPMARPK